MGTRRHVMVGAAVGVVATPFAMVAAHAADEETRVSIVAVEDFVAGTGTFDAEGGGLCGSGTTSQPDGVEVIERRRTLTFVLEKVFTCDDGSGTFTMQLRAWYMPCSPANRGVWRVISGTGDYAELEGTGQIIGTYFPGACDDAVGVEDVYAGHVFSE